MNASHGYKDGDLVEIRSKNGSVVLPVYLTDDLRDDTLLIYSGTKGVNNLTTSQHSLDGKCAIFQENRVTMRLAD
jgi:anaerobic selenocysteine-containing dehydrogenase